MSADPTASRRRARARFQTELPARVPPVEYEDGSLDKTVESLGLASSDQRADLRSQLLVIARDYRFSRDRHLARATRPDIAETLKVLAADFGDLIALLDQLHADTRDDLEKMLLGATDLDWDPGVKAIDTLAFLLDEVADAADNLTVLNDRHRVNHVDPVLDSFAGAARLAASRLVSVPDAAKWALVIIQQFTELVPGHSSATGGLAFIRAACSKLNVLARASAEVSKGDRGPRSSTPQMVAVERLKVCYEEFTGTTARHNSKVGRHYTGVLESRFGKFAEAVFHIIETDRYRQRGLAEAVNYAVWPCRSSGKSKGAAVARRDFERRIFEALELVTNNSSPAT